MSKFLVKGPVKISGEVEPVGNKNAVLKLIPASILFKGDYVLHNVPALSDVQVELDILEKMGAEIDYDKENQTVKINTDSLNTYEVPDDLAKKFRASVVFYGPLLARFGKVKASFPGGDKIGPRELKAHFDGLMQLGAEFEGNEWGEFELKGDLKAGDVYLYEPSVTATENIIMAAATLEGATTITGAACEPHVQELCLWLAKNGVKVSGVGSNILRIEGNPNLAAEGKEHRVWPDHIDIGTLAISAAITGGSLRIKNVRHQDLKTIKFFFKQLGLDLKADSDDLLVEENQKLEVVDPKWARIKGVYSQPWYGFPSDLMSLAIVLAMHVKGSTLFFEKIYPNRMAFVDYFNAAGGNIIICDPHRIVVNGPTQLRGFRYNSPDLRAGMAFFTAALASEGTSEIDRIEHIDRGYPNTMERFNRLGAQVERVD
jgi:UDP-N-acetylglucosamine 1-carboxyvinyltransferase